ncbi:hypothetical protein OCK74_14465 [Chitinophagaceae bacterium LB-8]|uniref:DUF4468 domain-containing protein n=1 Tax=Paraflavisolibacter caeni TaxID=2982496 RepID=A0A9X2XXE8_9BACT|nr:hypothetical protein [Paraflavisolibacter caeni]MCU7550322.1 hypothetical protein [Paraflavisolibacter caeni]
MITLSSKKFGRQVPAIFSFSYQTIIIALLFIVIIFSSCFSPRKMDKWIDQQYRDVPTKVKSNDYISVKIEKTPFKDRLSETKKGKTKFIPALFYYQWEFYSTSTLNPYIPVSNLSNTILPYANVKGLKKKLDGQKLELTIEKVPSIFSLRDKGAMIFLVVAYTGWEHIYIEPQTEEMVVSYRLLKDNVETKKGEVTVPNRDQGISLKAFQSTKKLTWKYLEQYNNNIKAMSKELVDKLLIELQQEGNLVKE